MAGPPPPVPEKRESPKATSLVSTIAGKRVVSSIKNVVASVKKPLFVLEHMTNHNLMIRQLNNLVDWVGEQVQPAVKSPLLSCTILQDIVFTATQTQYLQHGLGRPFIGFIVVNAFVADWSGRRVALAAGLSTSQYIGIRSTNAGVYSFLVF